MNANFRILIIDDNPLIHQDFIKILTSNLSEQNAATKLELDVLDKALFETNENSHATKDILPKFQIDTATQGKLGLERIEQAIKEGNPYSLAFVDIRMPPGWDGVETIKHIWGIDKDIQIVICTAYSDYSWEETIGELGQSDNLLILKKPFDQIAVRQLACALTHKWKLTREAKNHMQFLEQSVQKRTEELQYQATHDALTGLPNRILLQDRLQQAILNAERNHTFFAVLFFDLDRFKLINDSLSHAAGDELLCEVAKRLRAKIRAADTFSRLGGDEFVMLIPNLTDPNEIRHFAENILDEFTEPHFIAGHEISLTSSIGIALYPKDGKKKDVLLRNADIAMYHAKELGANQYQFYSEKMNEGNLKQLELEAELRQAIINSELFLCYQPQYDLKDNSLSAVEALVRWRHPTKGILLPVDFIPLAETTGLIVPMGYWILQEACRQNKMWQDAGLKPIRIAVNITTPQLRQLNFVDEIKKILNNTGLLPQYLELELSENTIINNQSMIKTINSLKELGVCFAVDDFGTGYSSLNYLRNLPLDRLKIDRTFVQNIQINRGDEVLIHAIISMAKSLNLEVLAEGVENQNQLNFLRSQACNEIQGFYFSHPLLPNELEELLQEKELEKQQE